MIFSISNPAAGVPAPPGDFESNYRHLKRLINKALKEGTPLEELRLIPKDTVTPPPKIPTRKDLLRLLQVIRHIKSRYQELLQCPVPQELEKAILAKPVQDRLPWETEALEKVEQWRKDVEGVRAQVKKELNDHLNSEFFRPE